jgi:peptide/nickel transport system substrate-binding protein
MTTRKWSAYPPMQFGRMNRRKFLAGSGAGVYAAAAGGFASPARAEPKKGGHFRMAMSTGSSTDTLDPKTYSDSYAVNTFWGAWSNSLCELDVDGNAVGDLAESIDSSDDFTVWNFKLRPGLQFHDGKSVTPEDVVTSIRHHMGEDSTSVAKATVKQIADIKADGPNGVTVTLSGGNIDFPYVMAGYHLCIMPSQYGKAIWDTSRTGAFSMVKFRPGEVTELKRNPNYHKPVYFDSVEVRPIHDPAARMNALMSGEVDYADRCDLKTIDLLSRNPDIEILEVPGYGHYGYEMNTEQAPYDNPDVRKAIKLSLNRQAIQEKVFMGRGTIGNDNPIAPWVKYGIQPAEIHAYDPERAKALLKKAGYDRLAISISASDIGFPGSVDAATLWQQDAAACNIDLEVVREANDGYWDNVWMKKPFSASYWAGRPAVDAQFTLYYAAEAPYNGTFWRNPHFNDLLVKGRSERDEAKRAAIYAEMQELVHEDGGVVVVLFFSHTSAHNKSLAHNTVAPDKQDDGGRIYERWWFA